MTTFTFRPIDVWPPGDLTDAYDRRRAPFRAGYDSTRRLLIREVEHLGGDVVIVQIAVDEADLRIDGLPRAHANPRHPGVVVAFESAHGPLKYATDVYDDWVGNLRAIALGLESLRRVDRYGIARHGEQYQGWRALPAGATENDVERGRELLREHGTVKAALMATHPDRGGDVDDFRAVQAARDYA